MLGFTTLTPAQRQQELDAQIGRNLDTYRRVYQSRAGGLREQCEKIRAISRECGERMRARQRSIQSGQGPIDITA